MVAAKSGFWWLVILERNELASWCATLSSSASPSTCPPITATTTCFEATKTGFTSTNVPATPSASHQIKGTTGTTFTTSAGGSNCPGARTESKSKTSNKYE